MMPDELQRLSNPYIRLLVAQRLGWGEIKGAAGSYLYAKRPCGAAFDEPQTVVRLPNFPEDLDAAREMEATMSVEQCKRYERILGELTALNVKRAEQNGRVADLFPWHASARMRCEAFLLVTNE